MADYWYIAKDKLKFEGKEDIAKIDYSAWRDLVDSDNSLIWFEETAIGKEFFNSSEFTNDEKEILRKKNARMDLNNEGNGKVQLNYNDDVGHIYIIDTRKSLNRIEKYYEIAKMLNAKLFKNRSLIDEKQMEKIRRK